MSIFGTKPDRECCGCGEPLALKMGQINLAEFALEPVPNVTKDVTAYICRTCTRRATCAWATKMRKKSRPHAVRPGEDT